MGVHQDLANAAREIAQISQLIDLSDAGTVPTVVGESAISRLPFDTLELVKLLLKVQPGFRERLEKAMIVKVTSA